MGRLREISIEITNKCSLKCIHCSSEAGEPLANELSLEEVKSLLSQAKGLGACIFTVSGGEPLLRSDIKEIIGFARGQGFEVRLQTCGAYDFGNGLVPIPGSFLDFFLKDKGGNDRVIYSILGTRETHDRITAAESFNAVVESVRKARKRNIFTEVHTVVNALNYKEILRIALMLSREGVKQWHLLRLVNQGRCRSNPELAMDAGQFEELQNILAGLSGKELSFKLKLGGNIDKRRWSGCSFPAQSCSIGKDKVLVRADGELTFCAALKHSRFGNVREQSLRYFWQEHPEVIKFRDFTERGLGRLEGKCSSCDIKSQCRGGCIAQRLYAYNSIYRGPDPLCYRTPKKG